MVSRGIRYQPVPLFLYRVPLVAVNVNTILLAIPFKGIDQGPQVSQGQYDVRSPAPSFSTTKIIVHIFYSGSWRTLILANNRVLRSTLVGAVSETRVTLSRHARLLLSLYAALGLIHLSDPFSPLFSPIPSRI